MKNATKIQREEIAEGGGGEKRRRGLPGQFMIQKERRRAKGAACVVILKSWAKVKRERTCLEGWCHSFSRLKGTRGGSNRGKEKEKLVLQRTCTQIRTRGGEKELKEKRELICSCLPG